MTAVRFPDYHPVDCPPATAVPANGTFYRLVSQNPPHANDALSHQELGKPAPDPCSRCSLSMWTTAAGARHLRKMYKRSLGGHLVASVTLAPEHGSMLGNNHVDFWPFVGVNRLALFTVLGP